MLQHDLDLPERSVKPRETGLTMVIDNGLSTAAFADQLGSAADYVDYVKFGWGTALVTPGIESKLTFARSLGIPYYLGGTLFEKHIQQNRFEEFVSLCRRVGATTVEVSNGTLSMSNAEKGAWIRKLVDEFEVVSEVGLKQATAETELTPQMWADYVEEDLANGAHLVIAEARESGTAGIAGPDGKPRDAILDAVLAVAPASKLIFEAPSKGLQTHLINKVGSNVNLGNIAPHGLMALETLRLGLRSDTFFTF